MGRAECWSRSFLKGIHGTCCSCCCFWGGLPQNQCSLTIGTGVILGFTASILLLAHHGCTFPCRVLREWMYSSLAFLVATCNWQHKAHKNQRINHQTAKSSHLRNPFGWCKNVASSDGHWCTVTAPESSHFNKLYRSCYCVSYLQFLKLHAAETKFSNQLTYWPKDPQKKSNIVSCGYLSVCLPPTEMDAV